MRGPIIVVPLRRELRGDMRKGGSRPGGRPGCPYDGLAYAPCGPGTMRSTSGRGAASTRPRRRSAGYHRIGRHLDAIGAELAATTSPPPHGTSTRRSRRSTPPITEEFQGSLRFMDNALSYAHRAIDDLLHEKGLPPHQPMDFAEWYDVVEVRSGTSGRRGGSRDDRSRAYPREITLRNG